MDDLRKKKEEEKLLDLIFFLRRGRHRDKTVILTIVIKKYRYILGIFNKECQLDPINVDNSTGARAKYFYVRSVFSELLLVVSF